MKMASRWHVIGITIDPTEKTRPLIEGIIKLLRSCKAGANHMVFSMANGFDRILKQSTRAGQRQAYQKDITTSAHGSSQMEWNNSKAVGMDRNQPSTSAWMMMSPNQQSTTPSYNMLNGQQQQQEISTCFDQVDIP